MAYGDKIKCKCANANCGQEWEAVKSKVRQCCSRACSEVVRIGRMKETKKPNLAQKPCVVCGTFFTYNPSTNRGRNKVTCSRVCQGKTDRPRISGDAHHMKTQEGKDKVAASTIAKYGGIGMAVTELAKKTRGVMKDRYGVEYALQNPDFLKTARENTDVRAAIEARTATYYANRPEIYNIIEQREWWEDNHIARGKTVEILSDETGISVSKLYAVGKTFGYQFKKRGGPSYLQMRFAKRLMQFARIESNTRRVIPPKEIDIWLPEKKIAIEVNGVYWHTSDRIGNTYHRDKMRDVEKIGGRLMQFWDYEIANKEDLVISMIKNACGIHTFRVAARQCKVVNVGAMAAKTFLVENHLQGNAGRKPTYIGLEYMNELIAVMSHGPSRFRPGATEILRFAVKSGWTIPGAFTRLIKNAGIIGPIVSYSDNRYTTGNVYKVAGFTLESEGPPTMWGTKDYDSLLSRQKFMRIKEWPGADPALTQIENMARLGYGVIHDAGQRTWVLAN